MTRRDAIARMRALATKAEHRYWRMLIDGKPWTVLTDGVGFIAVQANDMSAGVPTTKAKRWIESALRLTGRSSKRVTRATFDHWFVRRPRQLECGHLVGLVGGHQFDRNRVRKWIELMPGKSFDTWLRKHGMGHALMVRGPGALVGVMGLLGAGTGPELRET